MQTRPAACQLETLTEHVDRFTPDERTDRPALGAIHGAERTLLVEGGASPAHLRAFVDELEGRGRPPVAAIVLTHWHWDHSFGSSALDVPVVAHEQTARELAVQAGYDWSDEALDARVRDGLEIAFCAEMIRLELLDRSDLRIVGPDTVFADRWEIDLGGVTAVAHHVGGDHAADSCVVHAPGEGVLFLGDCHDDCLHAPQRFLTVQGLRGVVTRLRALDARIAVEGHADDVQERAVHRAMLDQLDEAAELVERLGADARAAATDPSLAELVGVLLVGELSSP